MRSALLLVCVIFIISVLASNPENPNEDEQQQQQHDYTNKPRELMCSDFGDCVHKISRALKRAQKPAETVLWDSKSVKDTAKDTLQELKESVENGVSVAEQCPAEASKYASTLTNDILSNVTVTARNVEKAVVRKVGQLLELMFSTQIETFLNAMWLFLDLKFVAGFIGLLGFAVAYGICVWVVFISPTVLARTLPRWQVPAVERAVRDVYCWTLVFCVCTAWIGHFIGRGISGSFDGHSLFYSLVIILINLFALERRSTKVLLEKMNLENQQLEKGKMVPESSVSSGARESPVDKNSDETVPAEAEQAAAAAAAAGAGDDKDGISSQLERLNAAISNLNWWSTFFNNLTMVSLTWYLVTLAEHVYVYTQGVSYKNSGLPDTTC